MLIFSILAGIKAYYMTSPRHTLVISTRASPYRLDSFPFSQIGPYKTSTEPILFARTFRPSIEATSESKEKSKPEEENNKGSFREQFSNIMFTSTMCKFFFYTVMAVLIFFIGYQTRKCHEGGSYVRLPTNN